MPCSSPHIHTCSVWITVETNKDAKDNNSKQCLISVQHCSKCFMSISLFNLLNNPVRQVLLSSFRDYETENK